MKRFVSLLMVVTLMISAISISAFSSYAATETDEATITISATNTESQIIKSRVGEVVEFIYKLDVSEATKDFVFDGKNAQGYLMNGDFRLSYSKDNLKLCDFEEMDEDNSFSFMASTKNFFPIIQDSVVVNAHANDILFNFSIIKLRKKFDSLDCIVCKIPFRVLKPGNSKLDFTISEMYGFNSNKPLVQKGEIKISSFDSKVETKTYLDAKVERKNKNDALISWNKTDGADCYNVYRIKVGTDENWKLIEEHTKDTSYVDFNLDEHQKYKYAVSAFRTIGSGASIIYQKMKDYVPYGTNFGIISTTKLDKNSVKLEWYRLTDDDRFYEIYFKSTNEEQWKYLTTTNDNSYIYSSDNISTCYFKIDIKDSYEQQISSFYINAAFGWNLIDGQYYYFDPLYGFMLKGWQLIDESFYCFDPTYGFMLKGWQKINGSYYYLEEDENKNLGHMYEGLQYVKASDGYFYFKEENHSGKMLDGWQLIDGKYHYFKPSPSGRMLTGWQNINGGYFYLDSEDGHMYEGLQFVEESNGYFYFKEENHSGRMLDGWQKIGNYYYYFKPSPSGRMLTGWQTINGYLYYLEENEDNNLGHMYEGLQYVDKDNSYYYFKTNGSGKKLDKVTKTGWYKSPEGQYYYFTGTKEKPVLVKEGFKEINGETYYLDPDTGIMAEGWTKIGDYYYYFKPNGSGKMQRGWLEYNGGYFYLDPDDGHMYNGFQYVKSSDGYFYFKDSGRMLDGWQIVKGKYHYFKPSPSGRMLTGWQKINGSYYYLEEDETKDLGYMYEGKCLVNAKGSAAPGYFYFKPDGSGKMQTGWMKVDGNWYYASSSGRFAIGWNTIDNKKFYFEPDEGVGIQDVAKMYLGYKEIDGDHYYFREENESGRMETGHIYVPGYGYKDFDPVTGKEIFPN